MTSKQTPYALLLKENIPDSIVYTDCYRSYNALDVSEFHHYRINHSTYFAEQKNHINGIENFWNQAKSIMALTANLSHFSWKNVSLDLTMGHQDSNSKPCENGVEFNNFLG